MGKGVEKNDRLNADCFSCLAWTSIALHIEPPFLEIWGMDTGVA